MKAIIHGSHSPWNSLMFLVPKKGGSYLSLVDLRRVNDAAILDPSPSLKDLLQSIGKDNIASFFLHKILKTDFWQILLGKNSHHISAISTPLRHYE